MKSVVTAGDGDFILDVSINDGDPEVAYFKTQQILYSNEILRKAGTETAILGPIDDGYGYIAKKLKPLPVEIVGRNKAVGSYCDRFPDEAGKVFSPPRIEVTLKDSLVKDADGEYSIVPEGEAGKYTKSYGDPFIPNPEEDKWNVHPNKGKDAKFDAEKPRMVIDALVSKEQIEEMEFIAMKVCNTLTDHLAKKGVNLIDFKLEFGLDEDDNIILLEVFTLDEVRTVTKDGVQLSKQVFRDRLKFYLKEFLKETGKDEDKLTEDDCSKILAKFTIDEKLQIRELYKIGVDLFKTA